MSANIPLGSGRPHREKANLHPGQVLLDLQGKRRTPEEKNADNMRAKALKEARTAAIQQACVRVGEIEAAMSVEQSTQDTVRAKPVRPRMRSNQARPMNVTVMPDSGERFNHTICKEV